MDIVGISLISVGFGCLIYKSHKLDKKINDDRIKDINDFIERNERNKIKYERKKIKENYIKPIKKMINDVPDISYNEAKKINNTINSLKKEKFYY